MTGSHARIGSSQYNTIPQEEEQRSRVRERRREGRYKTFDWAELGYKRHKEELLNDLSGRQWTHKSQCSVPPAPASSPEEPIIRSALENEYLQKMRLFQGRSLNIMATDLSSHSLNMAVSSRTSPESISPDSLEVDAGTIRLLCDKSVELLEAKAKEKKQVKSEANMVVVFTCPQNVFFFLLTILKLFCYYLLGVSNSKNALIWIERLVN